jgi:exosortase
MTPKSLARNNWGPRHLVGALLMMALAVFGTWRAWLDMFSIGWRDEESSHIFLVPIVFAWLVYVRRGRLRQCRPVQQWVGPLIVAAGWLMGWIGYNNAVQSFFHGGAVLVVLGSFLTVVGFDVLRKFLPAFCFLVFLVPVPGMVRQQIALPLQNATAQVTHAVFNVMDIETGLSGSVLEINGVEVGIAEACNGMRLVFALVLVSGAFAFGNPLRGYARALILIASPFTAVFCNVVRLMPTLWLYGYSSPAIAKNFHDYSGWCMLAVAFLMLMGILRLLRWALIPVTSYTLAYD